MGLSGSIESRRKLVKALLKCAETIQESNQRRAREAELIDILAANDEFDRDLVKQIIRGVADDERSPLIRTGGDRCWLYEMRRLDTVSDYVAGLKEDGVDPADL